MPTGRIKPVCGAEPLLGTGKHHQVPHQNQRQPDNRVAVPDVAFIKVEMVRATSGNSRVL
jgi:hypothetical protein